MKTKIAIVCLCLIVAASVVAKDAPEFRRLTAEEAASLDLGSRQDCAVGNLDPVYWSIGGWMTGFEGYKFLFDPNPQCGCPLGFLIETVHMALLFPDDGTIVYPYEFTASVDLEDAVFDPATGCWLPGPEDCVSDPYTVTIPGPGLYDVALPLPCECAYFRDPTGMPYMYMISFHFPGKMMADLVTDDDPTDCTSYNDWGSGWVDLVGGYGFPGNIVLWADAVCCDQPVGEEVKSLGEIKSLYK